MPKAELLEKMRTGWNELLAFIATLTPEQMSTPTDAAGWTMKDHLMHLAVWQEGVYALLEGRDRAAAMGVPQDVSIVGFDDRTLARLIAPPLTTIRYPMEDAGRRAARHLVQRVRGEAADPLPLLPPALVVRASTRPLSEAAGLRQGVGAPSS